MILPKNEWNNILEEEFSKPYFERLSAIVDGEYLNAIVYPPPHQIFRALDMVGYDKIKVVIIGQDPYHGENQANGMAFAVNEKIELPPSLKNIYQEIENDLGVKMPSSGTLIGWAKQGVLLLNTSLTVKKALPQSHSNIGWQIFTDAIIKKCSQRVRPMVFVLWGAGAIAKRALISPHHLILTAPHPSPLSAYRGFFGCRHFSQINEFLLKQKQLPIDWPDVDGAEKSYYANFNRIKQI